MISWDHGHLSAVILKLLPQRGMIVLKHRQQKAMKSTIHLSSAMAETVISSGQILELSKFPALYGGAVW